VTPQEQNRLWLCGEPPRSAKLIITTVTLHLRKDGKAARAGLKTNARRVSTSKEDDSYFRCF
jgi:hypothetical protein